MATRIAVALEDDLSGGPADETMRFGLGGFDYEIDLSKKNAAAFRKKIAPYIGHARKAGVASANGRRAHPLPLERSGDIRAWARDNGIAVSDRGRSPPAWLSSTVLRTASVRLVALLPGVKELRTARRSGL